MKSLLKTLTVVLLLLNILGAIYGGYNLIIHPDGSSLQLSTGWLQYTPFSDYLIPGIILITVNGFFGIFVLVTLIIRHRMYPWFVVTQGALLTGWILIQMIMIRTVIAIQVVFGIIGVLLILLGWRLLKT
jgi:hypothetical protein